MDTYKNVEGKENTNEKFGVSNPKNYSLGIPNMEFYSMNNHKLVSTFVDKLRLDTGYLINFYFYFLRSC